MFGLDGFNFLSVGGLSGGLTFFFQAAGIGLLITLFLLPIIIAFWLMSFKHQVTIRNLTGGKIVIKRDKAKIVKDKQGVKKLKLLSTPNLFKGERIALPPDEAVLTTDKGKMHIDVYRTQNGQYFWACDTGLKNKDVKLPTNATEDNFEPMDTMDRSFYANEWEEAERHKKKSIAEILTVVAPWIIIFLIVAIIVIQWDVIAAPALESQKISLSMQETNLKYQQELQKTTALLMQIQVLEDKYKDEIKPDENT